LRVVLFAPEDMLLVAGSPSLRRSTLDQLAATLFPSYASDLATYGRALQQRNGLLRAIRDEAASRDELRYWDRPLLDAGSAVVATRRDLLDQLAGPLSAAHAEIAPEEAAAGALALEYVTNAPAAAGESARDALARRLVETAEKELWNGTTLVGPHRVHVRDRRSRSAAPPPADVAHRRPDAPGRRPPRPPGRAPARPAARDVRGDRGRARARGARGLSRGADGRGYFARRGGRAD